MEVRQTEQGIWELVNEEGRAIFRSRSEKQVRATASKIETKGRALRERMAKQQRERDEGKPGE